MGFFGKLWRGVKRAGRWVGKAAGTVGRGIGKAAEFASGVAQPLLKGASGVAALIPHPKAQAFAAGAGAASNLIDKFSPSVQAVGRGAEAASKVIERGDAKEISQHAIAGLKRARDDNLYHKVGEMATQAKEKLKDRKQLMQDLKHKGRDLYNENRQIYFLPGEEPASEPAAPASEPSVQSSDKKKKHKKSMSAAKVRHKGKFGKKKKNRV